MFRVLVSDKIATEGLMPLLQDQGITCVQQKLGETDDLSRFDAIMVRSATKVTKEVIEQMSNLKIIARAGVGLDNVDVDQATKRGIVVVNAPSANTVSTAEHTFAMLLALARHIGPANNSLKRGEWNRAAFQGTELRGKIMGIIGFGRVGSELAKRAAAFELQVVAFSRTLTPEKAQQFGAKAVSLDELLETSDIISVHTALTAETKGLLNQETLARTKPGVMLVNCARGGIIDETALMHHLQSGHIKGAALDVFAEEPPKDFELINLDNVLVTPHIAASTREAQLNVAIVVAEQVLNFAHGRPVQNRVN